MSEPGAGRPQPLTSHGDRKASEEKNGKALEKQPASADVSQAPTMPTGGAAAAVQKQSPSADASKPQSMKPSETKTSPTTKAESRSNMQSTKPEDSRHKEPSEEKKKEPSGPSNQTSPSVTTTSTSNSAGKAAAAQADLFASPTSTETAKPKPEKMPSGAAGGGAANTRVGTAADQSSTEPAMDESALDSLVDTLGGPEDAPASPVYTGPEVTEDVSSKYLEELGKREGSLPPEYVKLLKSKVDGKDGVPPKADEQDEKPMTVDEIADALSSDFACSTAAAAAAAEERKSGLTENASEAGEIVAGEAAGSVLAPVPPEEEKTRSEKGIQGDALDALLDTLGGPEPEPEQDLTPVVEVSETKAKEKKEEKAGEREDSIPPEYRLKPELDKDGKPIVPKPEEKPKLLSESDLVDEFSKDFSCPAQPAVPSKPSKPSSTDRKPSGPVSPQRTKDETVPRATACTVQSAAPPSASPVGHLADEALEALLSSLGTREPDPDENKPVVDKVKEKSKWEQHKKLGEDEETIPPEYRATAPKGEDGRPLLPRLEEKSQLMSENDLLEALTEGFSCAPPALFPAPAVKKTKQGDKPTGSSEVISAATVSSVQSTAPLASTSGGKEMDEALDALSGSLGQREPDPEENKPVVDKVKENAESEHRDKLGERDDTIPPDYQKRLESGEQGKRGKPTVKDDVKREEPKKPADDSAAIDALSSDFDACAQAAAAPKHPKDKSGNKSVATKPAPKEKAKPKDPKTGRGQPSRSKPEKQKTS